MRPTVLIGCAAVGALVLSLAFPSAPAAHANLPTPQFSEAPVGNHLIETYQGSFLHTTAAGMLAGLGVTAYPEDRVFAFPEPSLGLGSTLTVHRAPVFVIKDADGDRLARSWKATVGEVLEEQGVPIGTHDKVSLDLATAIDPQRTTTIAITRVAEEEIVTKEAVAFAKKTVDDPNLEKGKEVVEQAGQDGTREKTWKIRRENGVEVSRRLVNQELVVEPVEQVTKRGTKVTVIGQGVASWYDHLSMATAHRTLPFGTKLKVVNLANNKSVVVTVRDRGPFVAGRIVDLSLDAFKQIADPSTGVINVRVEQYYE